MRRTAILLAAFLVACGELYMLQERLDEYRGASPYVREFVLLPDPEVLKTASLGYEALTADLLWLKAVQHIGERKISSEGYEWIYRALDAVTTLDPQFVVPYETGGLILTVVAENAELSNRLLEKGFRYNPDVWQLPFYLGFNNFYYMKHYKAAAMYMSAAAKMDGSPRWLPLLTSRLYFQAENPEYALEFLIRMYDSTKDEFVRNNMLKRINELKSVVGARRLQTLVDEYKRRFGTAPKNLNGLIEAGMLKEVPPEPNGGYYYIDEKGVVRSSAETGKLGVYTLGSK